MQALVCSVATMELVDEIRRYVFENYIQPAKKQGQIQVVVTSGEVHSQMGLKNCMPAVCNALRREKFQVDYNVELVREVKLPTVKGDSSTNKFIFKIL